MMASAPPPYGAGMAIIATPHPQRPRRRTRTVVGAAVLVVTMGAFSAACTPVAGTPPRNGGQGEVTVLLPRDGEVILGRDVPIAAVVSLGRSLADSTATWLLVSVQANGVVLGSAEIPVTSSIVVGSFTIQPPPRGTVAELVVSRPGSPVLAVTVPIVVAPER